MASRPPSAGQAVVAAMSDVVEAMQAEVAELTARLSRAKLQLYQLLDAQKRKCRFCGKTDHDHESMGFGPLIDVTITIARGEEGHSHVAAYVCNEHLIATTDALVKAGFGIHVHGGICFLEDTNCVGYSGSMHDCPTPESQYDD